MSYFKTTPNRVSHTISRTPSPKAIPKTSDRKASASKPAPLTGLHGRCASCGGGRKRR